MTTRKTVGLAMKAGATLRRAAESKKNAGARAGAVASARRAAPKPKPKVRSKTRQAIMVEKKKDPSESAGDRNVDQIRDILFGGQMRDYERRFTELAARLEQESQRLRGDVEKRVAALEKRLDEQLDKLGKQLRQEVGDRGKALDDLESRSLQAARAARNEINASFDQLRQEIAAADERERRALTEVTDTMKATAREAEAALATARAELRFEKVGREDLAALFTEVALRLKGDFDLPGGK